MAEQVVGLRFVVEGAQQADLAIKTHTVAQKKLTDSISKGINIVGGLEAKTKRLTDAYNKQIITEKTYRDALISVKREYKGLNEGLMGNSMSMQKASAEVNKIVAAHQKEIAETKRAAQAKEELAVSQKRAETAYALAIQRHNEEQRELAETARAEQALAAEKLRLESMYNKTAMAARVFEQAQVSLNRALELGVIDATQHRTQLENLQNAYTRVGQNSNRANTFINQFGEHSRVAGIKTNRFGMVAQQVGYQVGDFFVQVQSGTNAFVAFGQQATQLAGLLPGLAGAVVGIGISVGTMFLSMWDRTRQAKEGVDDLTKSYEELIKTVRESRTSLEQELFALQRGISDQELSNIIREREALIKQREALVAVSASGTSSERVNANKEIVALNQQIAELYSEQQARQRLLLDIEREKAEATERTRIANEKLEYMENRRNERLRVAREFIWEAEAAMRDMVAATPGEGWLDKAVNGAAKLAATLWDAAKAKAAATELSPTEAFNLKSRAEYGSGGRGGAVVGGRGTTIPERIDIILASRGGIYTPPSVGSVGDDGGGGAAAREQEDYLKSLQDEAEQKLRLVGLTDEQKRYQEILFELGKRGLPIEEERIQNVLATEEALRKATEAEEQRQALMDTVNSNIKSALMDLIQGTQSVEDAFKSMLRNIILAIYEQQIAEPFAKTVGNMLFGGLGLASANGNVFSKGSHITAYANGGVVNGPTIFPMSNGTGLMGEAGPEAIMPLKRTKSGKLGVVAEAGGNVNQTLVFNIAANGDESVKRIVQQEAPRIAEQAKAAVLDAKRRGGSYGGKF